MIAFAFALCAALCGALALVQEECLTAGTAASIATGPVSPTGLALHPLTGQLYVSDGNLNVLFRLQALQAQNFTLVAGNASASAAWVDGPAQAARFNGPWGVAFFAAPAWDSLAVCDYNNHLVRIFNISSQSVATLAGSGLPGWADGVGTAARLHSPSGIAYFGGNFFVSDTFNHCIRLVSTAGLVSTLAGVRLKGFVDGGATVAAFNFPQGIAVDRAGAVYLADTGNNAVRKLAGGNITTLSGNGWPLHWDSARVCCKALYVNKSNKNTCCTGAFSSPSALAVDWFGNVLVADTENHAVRFISPSGFTTSLAASTVNRHTSSGCFTAAAFTRPIGLLVDNFSTAIVTDASGQALHLLDYNFTCTSFDVLPLRTSLQASQSYGVTLLTIAEFVVSSEGLAALVLLLLAVFVPTIFSCFLRREEFRRMSLCSCMQHSTGLLFSASLCCFLPFLYGIFAGGPAAVSAMLALNFFFLMSIFIDEQPLIGNLLAQALLDRALRTARVTPAGSAEMPCLHFEAKSRSSPPVQSFSLVALSVAGSQLTITPSVSDTLDLTLYRVQHLSSYRLPLFFLVAIACAVAVLPAAIHALVLLLMSSITRPYSDGLVALFWMSLFPFFSLLWVPCYCALRFFRFFTTSSSCSKQWVFAAQKKNRCVFNLIPSVAFLPGGFFGAALQFKPLTPHTHLYPLATHYHILSFTLLLQHNPSIIFLHVALVIPVSCFPPGPEWLQSLPLAATAALFVLSALRLTLDSVYASTCNRGFALVPKSSDSPLSAHFFLAQSEANRDNIVSQLAWKSVSGVPGVSEAYLLRLLDGLRLPETSSARTELVDLLTRGGWLGNEGPLEGRIDWHFFSQPFSTTDLCYKFIKPATHHTLRSFYDTYRDFLPAVAVGPGTAFLSHAWFSSFVSLVEGLKHTENLLNEADSANFLYIKRPPVIPTRPRRFWVDVVFKNQWEASSAGTAGIISTVAYSAKTKLEFESNLCPLAETWVMSTATPPRDGGPSAGTDAFGRAWCLFEINLSVTRAGHKNLFLVLLPKVEAFWESLFLPVRLQGAKAQKQEDLDMIFHAVRNDGSFEQLDARVEMARSVAALHVLDNRSKAIGASAQAIFFNSALPHLALAAAIALFLGASTTFQSNDDGDFRAFFSGGWGMVFIWAALNATYIFHGSNLPRIIGPTSTIPGIIIECCELAVKRQDLFDLQKSLRLSTAAAAQKRRIEALGQQQQQS